MKQYKRKYLKYKYSNRLFSGFKDHIFNNKKHYKITFIFLVLGIISGVIFFNISNVQSKEIVFGYLNKLFDSIKQNEYKIDYIKYFIQAFLSYLKIAGIIWISGTVLVGIPVIYACIWYKGFCIGYASAVIIAFLGRAKGSIFIFGTLFFHNIIVIPCILAIAVSSIKMYNVIIKNRSRQSVKLEIYRHTVFSVIMLCGLIISSIIEVGVSTQMSSVLIKKII